MEYVFRKICDHADTIRLQDGDEIVFCKGENGQMIDPPDPLFCTNLKLALARVVHASGASSFKLQAFRSHR